MAKESEPEAALDRFEVRITRVRGELRTTEARPVLLTFDFDKGHWRRETDVYSRDVNPQWALDERFVYTTDEAHRLHKHHLTVTLSERSPHGDVVWGSGSVPLDSLALGCESVALTMIAGDGITCYGTVRFQATLHNVAEVCAHLSDLRLLNTSALFQHDVKLVYFELGTSGFDKGYRHCTERLSHKAPAFRARPTLKRDCRLRDMLSASLDGNAPLRIFFSLHRQVARNRTEQIGLGALPVRMLFRKVANGYMEAPAKIRVPLQNNQGTLTCKVLLKNIPRFDQLAGDDLCNVNGVITPAGEDLELRKLVPWMKLPKPLVPIAKPAARARESEPARERAQSAQSDALADAKLPGDPVSPLTTSGVSFKYDLPEALASMTLRRARGVDDAGSLDALTVSESGSWTAAPRSGKSVASYGTIEVGSALNSVTSEEAVAVANRRADSEWVPVEDPSNGLVYFASRVTHESLWLPPDWERELDSRGTYVFVDSASGARQYAFPADAARRYRESVFNARRAQ